MQPMKRIVTCLALAGPLWAAGETRANDSIYTDLVPDQCQTLAADEMGSSQRCTGLKGIPVYLKEGDLRQSVLFGPIDRELVESGFESYTAFNRVNDKIEWRRNDKGTAFATILRWFIEHPGPDGASTPESTGQVLVISRVADASYTGSCFVGMVDAKANADANTLARQVADEQAATFDCGMQPPKWYGKRGTLTSDRSFSWPEGYIVD